MLLSSLVQTHNTTKNYEKLLCSVSSLDGTPFLW